MTDLLVRGSVRFEIRPAPTLGGHEVLVHVNDAKVARVAGGSRSATLHRLLTHGDSDPQVGEALYQVFIRLVGENRSPSDLAAEVPRALDTDPRAWSATWSGAPGVRPPLAGVAWQPEDLGPW